MTSDKPEGILTRPSEICKFYQGKSLFITGAAGFLGAVLLETFLRCCPDIFRIYILLRPKKDLLPEDRKEVIFDKELFSKVKEKDPDVLNKVVVVSGDVSKDNLGMSEKDYTNITQEVSVVFHCAAAITFMKPLNYMIQQNVIGTLNIIELCLKLKKLDALVYTSTSFSNANRREILEKVYEMPFSPEKIMEVSRCGNEMEAKKLFDMCKPNFPNHYTFSKCVAENLLLKKSSDLPICIIRPSIILCTAEGGLPGFIEYGSGLVSFAVGVGKGFIRVMRGDGEKRCNVIPADVVANTHLIAAYFQANQSLPSSLTVYNCTADASWSYTWNDFVYILMDIGLKYPVPNAYQKPSLTLCKSPVNYWLLSIFDHYTPAVVIDFFLWATGRKLRLLKLYKFFDKCMDCLSHFTLGEWKFQTENFVSIFEKLNETDAALFYVDLKKVKLENLAKNLVTGAPAYRDKDKKPFEERVRLTSLRYFFTSLIKWSVLGAIVSIVYAVVF